MSLIHAISTHTRYRLECTNEETRQSLSSVVAFYTAQHLFCGFEQAFVLVLFEGALW